MVETRLDHYLQRVEREWDLARLLQDFRSKGLEMTELQWQVFQLLLCALAPKDIAELLDKQAGAIRNQLAVGILPKITELCVYDPENSLLYNDIAPLLARYGYGRSSWLWLQSQAKKSLSCLKPIMPFRSLGDVRDIADVSDDNDDKLPEVIEKETVYLELRLPPHQQLIMLNKGTSGKVYCLAPSRYAPRENGLSRVPLDNSGTIKFNGIGREQFLLIASKKRLCLSWLTDDTPQTLLRLEEAQLTELAEIVQVEKLQLNIFYSAFNVVNA